MDGRAHIFFLIGFRNRISVFASWARTYIRLRDGVRLILGSRALPGWDSLSTGKMPAPQPEHEPADLSRMGATMQGSLRNDPTESIPVAQAGSMVGHTE